MSKPKDKTEPGLRTAAQWRTRIKKACRDAETYQPYFDNTIAALSELLEKRDIAATKYAEGGAEPVVAYTNKAGATNPSRNPYLQLWMDLTAQALSYYRELGLTPAGRQKLGLDLTPLRKTGGRDELFGD